MHQKLNRCKRFRSHRLCATNEKVTFKIGSTETSKNKNIIQNFCFFFIHKHEFDVDDDIKSQIIFVIFFLFEFKWSFTRSTNNRFYFIFYYFVFCFFVFSFLSGFVALRSIAAIAMFFLLLL